MCRRRSAPQPSSCSVSARRPRNSALPPRPRCRYDRRMGRLRGFHANSVFFLLVPLLACAWARGGTAADPWTPGETVEPARFAEELKQEKDPYPTVIYVGAKTLYAGGHIPGAVYRGPGSTERGVEDPKKVAASLPKNS